MTTKTETGLKVLVFQEDKTWVAQCLEHDIAAQGSSIRHALDALGYTLLEQITLDQEDGLEPLSQIGQAPERYFSLFQKGLRLSDEIQIPSTATPRKQELTHMNEMRISA